MIGTPAALFEAHDPDMAHLQAALRMIRVAPKFDAPRLAAAHRATARSVTMRIPTERALSAAPCRCCGARGDVGCRHFLPYRKDA